jgi:hypothetical protein
MPGREQDCALSDAEILEIVTAPADAESGMAWSEDCE